MPYRLSENKRCVEKKEPSGEWVNLKCHETHDDALAHLRALEANVADAFKSWAQDGDASRIQELRTKALVYAYEPIVLDGTTEVRAKKVWGDLSVLVAPYGRDGHGEFFSPRTDFFALEGETKPVFYAHMEKPEGGAQLIPVRIGTAKIGKRDNSGLWADVMLFPGLKESDLVWEAAQRKEARASTGTEDYAKRMTKDGEILAWNIGEISLMDMNTHMPANLNAIAYTKTLLSQTPKEPAEVESLPDSADEPQTDVAAVIPLLDYDTRLRE